jgi:hypothetical protein
MVCSLLSIRGENLADLEAADIGQKR